MTNIDRRISKTKKAIYQAFLQLLNAKGYETTTVQDIIDLADVGRSTFYCHYESKELLLDELCRYLFHHLFEREQSISTEDYLIHLFLHFQKNQDHITSLLFSKNDYFLRQLQRELEHHVYPMLADELNETHPSLPASYLQHLVVTNFTETLIWWLKKGQDFTEQEVVRFYLDLLISKKWIQSRAQLPYTPATEFLFFQQQKRTYRSSFSSYQILDFQLYLFYPKT